ncbi:MULTISPECIES: EF-P beta-lysylation protein EpmB [Spongiibacter]|uniref:EF-P beta-lysylation protein EpmB n=1 Tax=Spongiibacter TaxID=630749 RepID=UPI000C4D4CF6|nr:MULTISPECIES: EF-P beta-lysylation protein EpmB [Spongiibacter]MAY38957.1 EF-P beta-lysylation protein EpmB [Spongiibacter sp.]MBI56927.1 EF-P beta-lysylation protein EpmB [Spongiibacter sp.]
MIPLNAPYWQTADWQEQYRSMIRDPQQLFERLQLNPEERPDLSAALRSFPLRVTEAFVAKMQVGDWEDPLLLQILPQQAEVDVTPGYSDDPLDEASANPIPGLIHKYHGRVLLITSPACAVHCRYCFRRNFPYNDNRPSLADWQQAIDYIASHPEISEVILSGGDPLSLPDDYLASLRDRLAAIDHVTTLRLHTRMPLVLPARITETLLDSLEHPRLQTVIVIHSNHTNELDSHSEAALLALKHRGFTLLNQSVLLLGINDNADTLSALSRRLFACGVLPYYLHVLDKVNGASHFERSDEDAVALAEAMLARLPGYLVPKLVREEPGALSKRPLAL